ncbi:hypothetical protein [Enterococcus alishanensis]
MSGCNSENNQDNSSNGNTVNTSEIKNDSAKSVDITAKGDYLVGTDIQPGSYYAVLTDLKYGPSDSDEEGDVTVLVITDIDGESDKTAKTLKEIGSNRHFILKDGDTVSFYDSSSPKSWEVKLLNESDYRAYMNENK